MVADDSAASENYFPASYKGEAHDSMAKSITVGTTNDNVMQSITTNQFLLQEIPTNAQQCYKFKEVSLPLVSVGKLCVHGMKISFDENHVKVYNKDNKLLLVGHRDPLRNLYIIPIKENSDGQPRVNVAEPRVGPRKAPSVKPSIRLMVPGIPCSLSVPKIPVQQLQPVHHQAENAYKIQQVPVLVSYLHATTGWIPKETLLAGIDENFYCS